MTEDSFERKDHMSQPGIVGASWWQESLANVQAPATRRHAIGVALGAGGALLGFGAMIALIAHGCSEDDEATFERRSSLEMQKAFGWSFGAATESVTFDGATTRPFDRAALATLGQNLGPKSARHLPYYTQTLFESLFATPTAVSLSDPENIVPLHNVLMPIFTTEMRRAYFQGKSLASLFASEPTRRTVVVVDLDGPEAVAFAAGAAAVFDPIFTFGNWPHPRGVVKAHRTLAAAAFFQPLFAGRPARDSSPPLLVLDRQRLAPYSDDATQFDNRYLPNLPDARALQQWGIANVLYVTAASSEMKEQVDLNETFVAYRRAGLDVKLVGADAFSAQQGSSNDGVESKELSALVDSKTQYFYGGHSTTHAWFWNDYPWSGVPATRAKDPGTFRPGRSYTPQPLSSMPSRLLAGAALGTVAVAVSRRTGSILGPLINRSGSWNRAESSYGGG